MIPSRQSAPDRRPRPHPDVVIYVNGIPLAASEPKNPWTTARTLTMRSTRFTTTQSSVRSCSSSRPKAWRRTATPRSTACGPRAWNGWHWKPVDGISNRARQDRLDGDARQRLIPRTGFSIVSATSCFEVDKAGIVKMGRHHQFAARRRGLHVVQLSAATPAHRRCFAHYRLGSLPMAFLVGIPLPPQTGAGLVIRRPHRPRQPALCAVQSPRTPVQQAGGVDELRQCPHRR